MTAKILSLAGFLIAAPFAFYGQAPLRDADLGGVSFDVAYTGRLMGYARAPKGQMTGDRYCAENPGRLSEFTNGMMALARQAHGAVLVGMGNNFSPDLEARTFANPVTGPGYTNFLESKDRFQWDSNTNAWVKAGTAAQAPIPMDNVGCYFRLARYVALVPGKHDFWFGAERLRLLAGLLARDPVKRQEPAEAGPVQMLAANVSITTKRAQPPEPLPPQLKSPPLLQNKDADLPSTVMPYLRQFRFKNARVYKDVVGHAVTPEQLKDYRICRPPACAVPPPSATGRDLTMTQTPKHPSTPVSAMPAQKIREELPVAKAWVCKAKSATNPDDPFRPPAAECVQLVEAETACLAQPLTPRMRSLCESHDLDLARSFDFSLPTAYATYIYPAADQGLQPGGNYSLCTEPRPNEYSCKQFTVRRPFLQDAESLPGAVPSVPCRAAGVPAPGSATYTLPCEWGYRKRTSTEPAVAVFGVVDPGLQQYIGLFNSSWLNTNSGPQYAGDHVNRHQRRLQWAVVPTCQAAV